MSERARGGSEFTFAFGTSVQIRAEAVLTPSRMASRFTIW
jgi:hypothetical protein